MANEDDNGDHAGDAGDSDKYEDLMSGCGFYILCLEHMNDLIDSSQLYIWYMGRYSFLHHVIIAMCCRREVFIFTKLHPNNGKHELIDVSSS